jgi:glycosyltransferase involved in cell wall biosynthesis
MLLSGGIASHTQRWANGLVRAGIGVVAVSQHDFPPGGWDDRIDFVRLPVSGVVGYFSQARTVARLFCERGCNLLNAHYATGYGVLATLSGIRPRLISVWGSDVYDFPEASPLHRWLVCRVLLSADAVASTSHAMAAQVRRLLGGRSLARPIAITPFGVDTARFSPEAGRVAAPDEPVIIGTVKTLDHKYGIDTLIEAFALLRARPGLPPLRLRLVGDGPQRAALERLAAERGLGDSVDFIGAVPHNEVPAQLGGLDVYVAASRLDSESFGVAVIEACACERPVVVTRVGGLPEVVRDGETGLIVPRDSPLALADAVACLVADPALRRKLGQAGRAWVGQQYEWSACVDRMITLYRSLLPEASAAASGVQKRGA